MRPQKVDPHVADGGRAAPAAKTPWPACTPAGFLAKVRMQRPGDSRVALLSAVPAPADDSTACRQRRTAAG